MTTSDITNPNISLAASAHDEAARVLIERLQASHATATASYAQWKRSNDDLPRQLVLAYLWWREARQIEGFLEEQYRSRGIRWKKEVNFTSLYRMWFDIRKPSGSDRVALVYLKKAAWAIHAHYESDPSAFKSNPEAKLFAYAKDQGGISGLAAGGLKKLVDQPDDDEDETEDDDATINDDGAQDDQDVDDADPDPVPEPEPDADIGALVADEFMRRGEGIATIDAAGLPLSGDLAVLLVREHAGQLIIQGAGTHKELVRQAAREVAARGRPFMSPTLRAIVATIETQALPSVHKVAGARDKYFNDRYGRQT